MSITLVEIKLKEAIYTMFVLLREFGESDMEHSFRIKIWKLSCMSPLDIQYSGVSLLVLHTVKWSLFQREV